MFVPVVLASGSEIRAQLLRNAGVEIEIIKPRIDEDSVKEALTASGAPPRDIADALAEGKSAKVAGKMTDRVVLGCDQVLATKNGILSKPKTPEDVRKQLINLRGQEHQLFSAAVIYDGGQPVWRHVGAVRLGMKNFSDPYLDAYIERNWDDIRWSVGGYQLEGEGVRLLSYIRGDYFTVLGIPLIEVLSYLTQRGTLPG